MPFRYLTADAAVAAIRRCGPAAALSYVLAVPVDLPLVGNPVVAPSARTGLATVPKAVWERRCCGAGTKGARYDGWAAVAVTVAGQAPADRQV